jgi:hypothetical protein
MIWLILLLTSPIWLPLAIILLYWVLIILGLTYGVILYTVFGVPIKVTTRDGKAIGYYKRGKFYDNIQ